MEINQIPTEKNGIKKSIIIISLAVILGIAIVAGATYLGTLKMMEKKNQQQVKAGTKKVEVASGDPILASENVQSVDMATDVIKKGYIVWQQPTDLGDLGFTTKENYNGAICKNDVCSEGVKYVGVGKVDKGKYAGGEIIDVVAWIFEGPGNSPEIFRVLKFNNEYLFLVKSSENFSDYSTEFIKNYLFKGKDIKKINNTISIEELDFPKELEGLNSRQKFILNEYDKAFFTSDKLKPAFVHPVYGQVWVTDEVKALNENETQVELNSHVINMDDGKKKKYLDIFGRYGFYIKTPDGMTESYKLVIDIFDKQERFGKLQAVWNDGKKNEVEYEINPSGCGGGDFVYDETLNLNVQNDLVLIGKTIQGDNLYGYKDTSSVSFNKLYNDIYWVEEGKKRKNSEEFLKINPKVFWVDPFGRTLAFYRSDIISPAECGKPVIYLYPEKTTDVSVNVKPGNGISYSDPEIGNGWNVRADEKSNLINLADGKIYPYLFWEGSGSVYYETPNQGFVVVKENLNNFLDEKLKALGLIGKEISDFKEFWIPKMLEINKPYYFVTFLSKHYIDELAPLSIEPKPETIIRVLMDYRGLENFEKVIEQKIVTPERKGFTAVEWGGMIK